jgi:hypothetical protein
MTVCMRIWQEAGFGEPELESVFNLNLVEMHSTEYEVPIDRFSDGTERIEWFELTELGRTALQSIKSNDV